MNPLNQDMGYLRTELITGLIKAAAFNIKHGANSFKLFELANVHEKTGEKLADIIESKHLACIVYGKNQPENVHSSVFLEDFYTLKGVLESLFMKNFSMKLEFEQDNYPLLENSYSIIINRQKVGYIGHISNILTKNLKVNLESLHGFYVNLEPIKNMLNRNKTYKKITLYPESQRDLNLVLNKNQNTDQIVKLIKRKGKRIIKSVTPVNIFTDPSSLGEKYKSVTFSIIFQHKAKTLEDKDVNPIIDEIINVAQNEFSAKLRV
jgi:phenylalanyl-tRNA synthetase beta chain